MLLQLKYVVLGPIKDGTVSGVIITMEMLPSGNARWEVNAYHVFCFSSLHADLEGSKSCSFYCQRGKDNGRTMLFSTIKSSQICVQNGYSQELLSQVHLGLHSTAPFLQRAPWLSYDLWTSCIYNWHHRQQDEQSRAEPENKSSQQSTAAEAAASLTFTSAGASAGSES